MKEDYYLNHSKAGDFWLGVAISVGAAVLALGAMSGFGGSPFISTIISIIFIAGTVFGAIYFMAFCKRRFLGIGILLTPVITFLIVGGCFYAFFGKLM